MGHTTKSGEGNGRPREAAMGRKQQRFCSREGLGVHYEKLSSERSTAARSHESKVIATTTRLQGSVGGIAIYYVFGIRWKNRAYNG